MKNLEEEQRKMRERMGATMLKRAKVKRSVLARKEEVTDAKALLKRIEVLESENARLKSEIAELRGLPPARLQAYEADERERRHLFMKYSNVRRY
jgi:cell shape-determining protein MreC